MAYLGRVKPTETSAAIVTGTWSGDGSTVAFTMSDTPANDQSVFITIDGVDMHVDSYSFSGTTLTFASPPASGTNNIEYRIIQSTGYPFTPSDNSVTPAKTTGMQNVIQEVWYSTGDVVSGTTQFVFDDTIPQNTEGVEMLTVTITPTDANNILIIDSYLNFNNTATYGTVGCALFQDSVADALAASIDGRASSTNWWCGLSLKHRMVAGTTSPTTFKIRAGVGAAGTSYINASGGTRALGGVLSSYISVLEVKP